MAWGYRWTLGFAVVLLSTGPSLGADASQADECGTPCFAYELSAETQLEGAIATKPDHTDTVTIGPSDTLTLTATPVEDFNLVGDFVLEQVLDADVGQTNAFEDIGLYTDELYADYTVGPVYLKAGKFSPDFSLALAELGGNHGNDFASNFDSEESWAVLAGFDFELGGANNRIAAVAFTRDRTVLSESLFTNRGRTHLSDGGAGNVKGLGSVQLQWDGCSGAETPDCWSDGAWGYRVATRWQKAGDATDEVQNPKDEWAFTAATFVKGEIAGHDTKLIAEADYAPHLGGEVDGALAGTLAAEMDFDPVTLYGAVEVQNNLVSGGANTTGYAVDVAADYEFADHWTLGAGYAYVDTGSDEAAHYLNLSLMLDLDGKL